MQDQGRIEGQAAPQPYNYGSLSEVLGQAAEVIPERDGIQALTIRAVDRAAGASYAAPAHHFGDLAGLVSGLAATGCVRFRTVLLGDMALSGPAAVNRLRAMGRGCVRLAREPPSLFRLMFRGERLDARRPVLQAAMRDTLAGAALVRLRP